MDPAYFHAQEAKNSFFDFVNQAINEEIIKPRWVYGKNKISCVEKSAIPAGSVKKIEIIIRKLNIEVKKLNKENLDNESIEKLELMKIFAFNRVNDYKKAHGKVYLFFSKLFFGDVIKLSKDLETNVKNLRNCYEQRLQDLNPQPKQQNPEEAQQANDAQDAFMHNLVRGNKPPQPKQVQNPEEAQQANDAQDAFMHNLVKDNKPPQPKQVQTPEEAQQANDAQDAFMHNLVRGNKPPQPKQVQNPEEAQQANDAQDAFMHNLVKDNKPPQPKQ